MKIFVINMPSNPERREFMTRQMANLGLEFEFFPAVIGRDLTAEELRENCNLTWARRRIGREMNPAEIGCALSHLRIYQKIVRENIEAALVLEDDCWLTPSVVPFLAAVEQKKLWKNFDVLLLSGAQSSGKPVCAIGSYYIFNMIAGMFTHAYVISANGAKSLAENLFPIRMQADDWGWMIRHQYARFATVFPILATQNQYDLGSSTTADNALPSKRSFAGMLCHKMKRVFWKFIYRFY